MSTLGKICIQVSFAVALLVCSTHLFAADDSASASTTLYEIYVTAERVQEYIRNHPQLAETVGYREIYQRRLSSVEEVLKIMPGVEVYQSSGTGSRVSIRGSGRSTGVLVLLNGRPLNSNQYGNLDLNTVPVDLIESVTVFKPPVPVWLGPGGSDGAINIVTRSPVAKSKGKDASNTTVKLNGGSFGYADGSLSQTLGLFSGTAQITASATHKDGKRANSDRDMGSVALNWSREGANGSRFAVNGRYYDSEYGSAGPSDNPTPDARQHYHKGSVDLKHSSMLGSYSSLDVSLFGDSTSLRDRSQTGFTATLDEQKAGLKLDVTRVAVDESWEGRLAWLTEWDGIDHTLSGNHERYSNSLSGQYDRRFGPVTTTLGLRGDVTSDYDVQPGFTAGVGWGISDKLLLKAKGGYTVNVPSFGQLYQTAHGSIDQTRGNPDLEEERVWSYDLGIEYRPSKANMLQLTFFRTDTYDLISYQRGTDLIYRPVNIDNAMREGAEFTVKYALFGGLISESNLIVQHSSNSETDKQLPYTPQLKIKQAFQYTLPTVKTRLEGAIRYEGRRYSQVENLSSQELGEFVTVDLKVAQPFTFSRAKCDWYLKVDNLFDRQYQVHLGYPDDGIRFSTGVQARF